MSIPIRLYKQTQDPTSASGPVILQRSNRIWETGCTYRMQRSLVDTSSWDDRQGRERKKASEISQDYTFGITNSLCRKAVFGQRLCKSVSVIPADQTADQPHERLEISSLQSPGCEVQQAFSVKYVAAYCQTLKMANTSQHQRKMGGE